MSDKKARTTFVPSGAKIRVSEGFQLENVNNSNRHIPRKSKKQNSSSLKDSSSVSSAEPQVFTPQNIGTVQPPVLHTTDISSTIAHERIGNCKISPPGTICKNKRRSSVACNKINVNAGLYEDIKNLKIVQDAVTQFKCVETSGEKIQNVSNPSNDLNSATSGSFTNLFAKNFSDTPKLEKASPKVSEEKKSFKAEIQDRIRRCAEFKEQIKKATLNSPTELNSQKEEHTKCTCESCDGLLNCPAWCSNNITFDNSHHSKKVNRLLRIVSEKYQPLIIDQSKNKIILHGTVPVKPVHSVDETFIHKNIQNVLRTMNCTSAKLVQSYIWPAVQRGLNIFMVGPPKTGKTLAYLPSFCSFAMNKNDRYTDLCNYEGPIIIILCLDHKSCFELLNLIKTLISESKGAVTVEVLSNHSTTPINCDILLTVPSILEDSLKTGTVKLKRLCHLAIEDAHVILKKYGQNFANLLKVMNQLLLNRPYHGNIQIVVSSQKWSTDLETLLKSLYITPLVYFEDFLEAAIYSNIEFKKKKFKSSYKQFFLTDILKGKFLSHRTVVFCNDDDILDLRTCLEQSGIECIAIYKGLGEDDILENEDMWCSLPNGSCRVLLCSDGLFEKTVRILKANWIVHFDLPSNWDQFSKRFRCLAENISSPLTFEDFYGTESKLSVLIIDELCENQLFLDYCEVLTRNAVAHLKLH